MIDEYFINHTKSLENEWNVSTLLVPRQVLHYCKHSTDKLTQLCTLNTTTIVYNRLYEIHMKSYNFMRQLFMTVSTLLNRQPKMRLIGSEGGLKTLTWEDAKSA